MVAPLELSQETARESQGSWKEIIFKSQLETWTIWQRADKDKDKDLGMILSEWQRRKMKTMEREILANLTLKYDNIFIANFLIIWEKSKISSLSIILQIFLIISRWEPPPSFEAAPPNYVDQRAEPGINLISSSSPSDLDRFPAWLLWEWVGDPDYLGSGVMVVIIIAQDWPPQDCLLGARQSWESKSWAMGRSACTRWVNLLMANK